MPAPVRDDSGQHAVVLRQVHKAFGSVTALHSVDLQIEKNEFFSILGPSGCGKTTLMRMVAGFDEPTSGTIELDGRPVAGLAPHRRDLNMLFQSYALFPHLSVAQNVGFELSVRRVSKAEGARRVAAALDLVRMSEFGARRPHQLSGGQRQRVALARAVVGRPAVVLLDEPLAALDLKLRQEMQLELKRMQRETGITFVYVTHDQGEALTMSDRIAVFDKGRLEQVAAPRELYEAPATEFVARFIGTSTLLRGTGTGSGVRVTAVGELATGARTTPGATYDVVLRPEDIAVQRSGSRMDADGDEPPLRGRVNEVVYQGSIVKLLVELPDGSFLTAEDSPARLDPDLRPGDEVGWSHVPRRTALLSVSERGAAHSTASGSHATGGQTARAQGTTPSASTNTSTSEGPA